ncbi:MAG TPA: 2'-5' RNA ligase family protein [Verrucomicrobiae bacterium]|nr:2'-5' RNA ligase family protein [Verrucomicrobiae bacterium]
MKFLVCHVIDGDAGARVDRLRQTIAERFHVNDALRLPVHLTLIRPFEHAEQAAVSFSVEAALKALLPFTVQTKGFAAFRKDVWFIELEQDEKLFAVKRAIEAELGPRTGWTDTYEQNTHFHITLAYKIPDDGTHERIGEFLKTQSVPVGTITIDSVSILTHDGARWIPTETLPFPSA